MQPPAGMGVVHESQMFRRSHPLKSEVPLEISGEVTAAGDAHKFDFSLVANGMSIGDMQTRLRFVTPDLMGSLKGGQFRAAMDVPGTRWIETTPLTRDAVSAYLKLSHDPNPIHRDDMSAQAVGLLQAVVPGMLIAGLCEAVITSLSHMAIEMRTRFLAPLAVEKAVRLGVQVKSDRSKSRARVFVVADSDRIIAIADFILSESS
ncbi:MAG: MaoC family dehydratase [Rhodobacteraceae bacterium]|nr:MaoC family dehydratase [Paracoccaceae bacterium]